MPEDKVPLNDDEYMRIMMYLPDKLSKCINCLAEDYLKGTDLKPYYLAYIMHIYTQDGITQKELKHLIPYDKSRISVVIHQLIDMDLVYDDGKGRNSSLHLTKSGIGAYSICKMFFDIIKKEILGINGDCDEELKRKNIEFNAHLDSILQRYNQ